jgi:hypothetical protein
VIAAVEEPEQTFTPFGIVLDKQDLRVLSVSVCGSFFL